MALAWWTAPQKARSWPYAGFMLAQRRRRWANNKPALGRRLVFAESTILSVETMTWSVNMMKGWVTQKVIWDQSGLEINFLEHWPSGPPVPKIWWSSSISGGPVRIFKIVSEYTTTLSNKFGTVNFSGLYVIPLLLSILKRHIIIYNFLNNFEARIFSGLSDHCYPEFWWSCRIFGGLGPPDHH